LAASFDYELRENNVVKTIRLDADFRRHAAEARRMADKASDPQEKQDLREVERRWRKLAQNHEALATPSKPGTPSKPRRKR
jgi:hypothetical protein